MGKRSTDILVLEFNDYNMLNGLSFLREFELKLLHQEIFKVGGEGLV
jgi:hypothetical protein